jgi:hypothetical protein
MGFDWWQLCSIKGTCFCVKTDHLGLQVGLQVRVKNVIGKTYRLL